MIWNECDLEIIAHVHVRTMMATYHFERKILSYFQSGKYSIISVFHMDAYA